MEKLLYGVSYYDEYMPYERLDKDIELMKDAGINVVRIAESTWSTLEPQNNQFDFTSIDRVMDAMHAAGIAVIIGTPTYALPTWMVKEHPNVLATTKDGKNKYGPRQNMDITNPTYLFYAARVIRKLIDHVKDHPSIIGYQADNETKHYGTSGDNVQLQFVKFMRDKYDSLDAMNHALGLDYWSNRINSWEDFPNVDMTINASLAGDYAKFKRNLVTQFLAWQVSIINEYKKEGHFVTQNFDFDWRNYSFGIQPDVDHFQAAKAFDVVGVDIYHPSQDELTGCEISFCGDVARSMKSDNYLVIETQAQGHAGWLPYPGQLRLQAFSHIASGANMVAYWHYHSIHNSFETYWKGLLSQDFEPSPTYDQAAIIGQEFERLSEQLVNMKTENKVAMLFSNESLSAINWFGMFMDIDYNTVLRQMYDTLYRLNVGCDMVDPTSTNFEEYAMIVVPPLYAASDELLNKLNKYVENGGHIIYGIRSGYSNENVKVRSTPQPGLINAACGIHYSQFTEAKATKIGENSLGINTKEADLSQWIELLTPTTGRVLASYEHPYWGSYAAITENNYGEGIATYIGCCPTDAVYEKVMINALKNAGLWGVEQEIKYPVIVKNGTNQKGSKIHYFFNYSMESKQIIYPYDNGIQLISGDCVKRNQEIVLEAWDVCIVES